MHAVGLFADTIREHNEWLTRALRRHDILERNSTMSIPRGQSFFMAFKKSQPLLSSGGIVSPDTNMFTRDLLGLHNVSNGRPDARNFARFTFFEGPSTVCFNAFVYKDWTAEGLIEGNTGNEWYVPARRNPRLFPPAPEAIWDRG